MWNKLCLSQTCLPKFNGDLQQINNDMRRPIAHQLWVTYTFPKPWPTEVSLARMFTHTKTEHNKCRRKIIFSSGSLRRVVLVKASITRVLHYRKSDDYYYCHYEIIGFSIICLLQNVKISHLTLTPASPGQRSVQHSLLWRLSSPWWWPSSLLGVCFAVG